MNDKQENYVGFALIIALIAGVTIVWNLKFDKIEHTQLISEHKDHKVWDHYQDDSLKIKKTDIQPIENSFPFRNISSEQYHDRRAYPGAPPVIPHPLMIGNIKLDQCLSCHLKGGVVPSLGKIAPVSPHPHFISCRQCHVPQMTQELFVDNNWDKVSPPKTDLSALPGGPPPIPHSLQLRENCNSCHGPKSSLVQLRSPHPERVNCRQCHVPALVKGDFTRKISSLPTKNDSK